MNPFDVLGLSGTAPTRADVRRAYAALVRLHPPDEDPAGFRRVRDAYEVLAGLRDEDLAAWAARADRAGEGSPDPALAEEGADEPERTARPRPPVPPLPPTEPRRPDPPRPETETDPIGAFEADLRARLDAATSAAQRVEVVRGVMPTVELDPALARATAAVVAATDPPDGGTLAAAATPTFATALLASGDVHAVSDLAAQWDTPAHWPHLIAWARQADDHVPPIAALAATDAVVALARAVAVLLPHTALGLADAAFQHASPALRTSLPLADLDRWAAASIEVGEDHGAARRGLALWGIRRVASDDPGESAELDALEGLLAKALDAINRGTATDEHRRLVAGVEEIAEQKLLDVKVRRLDILAKLGHLRRQAPAEARRRWIVLWIVVPALLVTVAHVLSTSVAPTRGPSDAARDSLQKSLDQIQRVLRSFPPPPPPDAPPPGWKPLTPVEEQELEALRGLPAPLTDEALRRRRDELADRARFMRPR